MSKPTLIYFGFPGRAGPIRDAFRLNGVDFEDKTLSFPEFGALKGDASQLPLGSLPVLQLDGRTYTESNAILKFAGLAGKGLLYPKTPIEQLVVDEVLANAETVGGYLAPTMKMPDGEEKIKARKELGQGPIKRAFEYFEKRLAASTGDFFVGDTLTVADLKMAALCDWVSSGVLDGFEPSYLDDFPAVKKLAAAVAAKKKE